MSKKLLKEILGSPFGEPFWESISNKKLKRAQKIAFQHFGDMDIVHILMDYFKNNDKI